MSASGEGWSFEKKLSPVKIITWEHSQQKVDGHVYLHSGEKNLLTLPLSVPKKSHSSFFPWGFSSLQLLEPEK